MQFEYYYGEKTENYQFYRVPKSIFTEKIFRNLSMAAKFLYCLLLDRANLSRENGWVDEKQRVYVYYSIRNVKKSLQCANSKACGVLKELDEFGLIERRRQGLGKPTIIYVKNFDCFRKSEPEFSEKQNFGVPEIGISEFREPESNKNENNNTELNNTYLILSDEDVDKDVAERAAYRDYLYVQLGMENLCERYPYDREMLLEIFNLIVDSVCSKRKTIQVARDVKPAAVVRSQLMKMNSMHMEYVLDCMKNNRANVRNIKQYLLATIYNAPLTMQSYVQAKINNDMATVKPATERI